MQNQKYDLVVIGGGPGGYVAAIRASQLKMKVALVEREHLGGVCLNWGCIPTKALLRSSEIAHLLNTIGEYGFTAKDTSFDIEKMVQRSRKVAKQLSSGVSYLLKKNNISVFDGAGRIKGQQTVEITSNGTTQSIEGNQIILATGARARIIPGIEPNGKQIWTYKEAMVPSELPKSLLVVGSGAIGMEFASFYSDLGCNVTVVEIVDRILPQEDPEIAAIAEKAFRKQGMTVHTSTTVESVEIINEKVSVKLHLKKKNIAEVDVDKVILAVGITGNVEDLGLEDTKIQIKNGHIKVDKFMATAEPNVYAIGDLVGPPWLAHKASHEAALCVENIAGIPNLHPLERENIPACTYCRPQIASIGINEEAAKESGRKIRVGRFPYKANGKALALGESEGLIKTIFDFETGELIGAHMIGNEVTELIQGFAIAKTLETTEEDLIRTVFPHPTLSEMMHESVLDAFGRTIHL